MCFSKSPGVTVTDVHKRSGMNQETYQKVILKNNLNPIKPCFCSNMNLMFQLLYSFWNTRKPRTPLAELANRKRWPRRSGSWPAMTRRSPLANCCVLTVGGELWRLDDQANYVCCGVVSSDCWFAIFSRWNENNSDAKFCLYDLNWINLR